LTEHGLKQLKGNESWIARGYIVGAEGDTYTAVATPLHQHQGFVASFLATVFGLGKDHPAVIAAEIHDMYKPYTMRVEEVDGVKVIGFRGHPYRLSFLDVEKHMAETRGVAQFNDVARRKVAVVTAVGRLHHFINVRDVQTFFESLAMSKAYLNRHGVRASVNELRREILDGVVLLHMSDMVAGLIEGIICDQNRSGLGEIIDSDSLLRIEPHIPVSVTYDLMGSDLDVWLYIHGLKKINIRQTQFSARYTVYTVTISGDRVVSSTQPHDFNVNVHVCHKEHVHIGLC